MGCSPSTLGRMEGSTSQKVGFDIATAIVVQYTLTNNKRKKEKTMVEIRIGEVIFNKRFKTVAAADKWIVENLHGELSEVETRERRPGGIFWHKTNTRLCKERN